MTPSPLEGRVALVTGATGALGQAIVRRMAAEGADLAVGYGRDCAGAAALTDDVRRCGRRGVAVQGDVGRAEEVRNLVAEAERALGPIDVLVSNAGVGPVQSLEEISCEEWDRVLAVNLRAGFLLAQLVPGMRARGFGRIAFVSSVAAFIGGVSARTTRRRRLASTGSPMRWLLRWRPTASP